MTLRKVATFWLSQGLTTLSRWSLCIVGLHTRPTGFGFDACGRACGYVRNPDAARAYLVTLKDGSVQSVVAISERHARNIVVYGGEYPIVCEVDGTVRRRPFRVHPENIVTAQLAPERTPCA